MEEKQTEAITKSRDASLDLLKVVGSVFIVLGHYQQFTSTSFQTGYNWCGGPFVYGNMVELFFIISGILTYRRDGRVPYNKYGIVRNNGENCGEFTQTGGGY